MRRAWTSAFILAICLRALVAAPAVAADWTVVQEVARAEFQYEAWAGIDGAGTNWSAYGGLNAALFGDIRENGWRLRSSGGYGRYSYGRPIYDPFRRRLVTAEFHGEMTFTDVLLGYQQAFGPLIVKAYAGLTEEHHRVLAAAGSPLAIDDENAVQGAGRGVKLALETWVRLGEWGFVQTDVNWSQPFAAYSSRLRLGTRLNPAWSTGLETAIFGNANHDQGRAGAFLRFEWSRGEVSLSAGAGGDSHAITGAYGSLNAMLRF